MNTIKILIASALIVALCSIQLYAQTAPGATVDPATGNLILDDDTVIPVPDGTVNQTTGALEFTDGSSVAAPTGTVNTDGSLYLPDTQETLTVPRSPRGGAFIINWLGADLYDYNPTIGPETNQTYFSFTFKNIRHFAADNWFWFFELSASIYINPDTGNRNLDDGIWCYSNNLFPGQTSGTWIWIARKNLMSDLRDQDGDGVLEIADGLAGDQLLDASIYVINPSGYDALGSGWFFFREWPDGNYIIRRSQTVPNPHAWAKLTDPVNPSPNFGN